MPHRRCETATRANLCSLIDAIMLRLCNVYVFRLIIHADGYLMSIVRQIDAQRHRPEEIHCFISTFYSFLFAAAAVPSARALSRAPRHSITL